MPLRVSHIESATLRRLAMICSAPFMLALVVPLAALRGVIEILDLLTILATSWGPAWRGERAATPGAEVGVVAGKLRIHIPIELIAAAADHLFHHPVVDDPSRIGKDFHVTDDKQFALSIAQSIRRAGPGGFTMLHRLIDEAAEIAVDDDAPGFEWRQATEGEDPCPKSTS